MLMRTTGGAPGHRPLDGRRHALIAEFSPSGSFDASVTPAPITVSSHGGADALEANGQYVFGTTVFINRSDTDVQVQRFTATGSPDPTFTNPAFDYIGAEGSARDGPDAVTLQSNGQVVVGGSHFCGTSVFGLARLNIDGRLDVSFRSGGVVTTSCFGDESVAALVIQPDGKIVAVGFAENNATGQTFVALARYLGA